MTKNNTILSKKESLLIESLISKYGLIVNVDQIKEELGYSGQKARNAISKMIKNGWLVKIKNGVYYVSNLESRGFVGMSILVIAQSILIESYISFETALQYRGFFDQYLRTVVSVCLKKQKSRNIQGINYKFIKTSKKNFYGWDNIQIEGKMVRVATFEKAILDMVCFHRSVHSLDLVLEKLRENKEGLDLERLKSLIKGQSITVQRIMGFLLDKIDIDSSYIYDLLKGKKGVSLMTKDSDIFNHKWRLYYHNYFTQYDNKKGTRGY